MGFGTNDDVAAGDVAPYTSVNFESANTPPQIDAGKSRVVQFNLFSGLLSQGKYIPLQFLHGGMVIELEFVGDVLDCRRKRYSSACRGCVAGPADPTG